MFNPCAFNANIEPVAHLAFVLGVEFAAQECGDVIGLDGVDRRPAQVTVDRRQFRLTLEYNLGGVLALIHAPVIGPAEGAMNRAEPARKLIQPLMQTLDLQSVGDLLSARPVGDFSKSIIDEPEGNLPFAQYTGQPVCGC